MDFFDVERIAADGESERVEFKLSTGGRREAARTLSAMLNGGCPITMAGDSPMPGISTQLKTSLVKSGRYGLASGPIAE